MITGGPDVVWVNILIFTWTTWDELPIASAALSHGRGR